MPARRSILSAFVLSALVAAYSVPSPAQGSGNGGQQTRPAPGGQGGGRPGGNPGGSRPGGQPGGGRPSPGGGGSRPSPGGNRPSPGGNRPSPGQGGNRPNPGGNRPSPGGNRPSPGNGNRPSPGNGNRPNPGNGNRPNPGGNRPGNGNRPGGRPPQWGHRPPSRPNYNFRPTDRNYLRHYYRNRLIGINIGRRPRFAIGGFFPYGDIGYLSPLPADVYGYLPPPPMGYNMGYFDGYVVVYDPLTYFIANVIDLLQ